MKTDWLGTPAHLRRSSIVDGMSAQRWCDTATASQPLNASMEYLTPRQTPWRGSPAKKSSCWRRHSRHWN
jgi:hypothetical protein